MPWPNRADMEQLYSGDEVASIGTGIFIQVGDILLPTGRHPCRAIDIYLSGLGLAISAHYRHMWLSLIFSCFGVLSLVDILSCFISSVVTRVVVFFFFLSLG